MDVENFRNVECSRDAEYSAFDGCQFQIWIVPDIVLV